MRADIHALVNAYVTRNVCMARLGGRMRIEGKVNGIEAILLAQN